MSTRRITIIGAGLAGLTLARCLKAKKIPVTILEKSTSKPRFNYGIALYAWAYTPLLHALNVDESAFRQRLAVDASQGGNGSLLGSGQSPIEHVEPGTFRCHRGALERWLREGLDIRWDHTLKSIETSLSEISIRTEDGQTFRSNVLVGADGVHSATRQVLLPEIVARALPYVVFYGRRTVAVSQFEQLLRPYMQDRLMLRSSYNDTLLGISIDDYSPEGVQISYTYSRPARENDPLYRPNRTISSAEARDHRENFQDELLKLVGLEPLFAEIFDIQKVSTDRILNWLMRSIMIPPNQLEDLAEQGVFLIGDAAHAMPILGGEGANMAIKDGVDLADRLTQAEETDLKIFPAEKRELWSKEAEKSEMRLSEMHISTGRPSL